MASDAAALVASAELAAFLGVKPQTLRKWRLTGQGPPYVKLGGPAGRVVYRRSDVDTWIESHRFTSTAAESVARGNRRG